jgi:hypothetical protein
LAPRLSLSDAVTFTTDTYTPPGFITAIPLDMTGDYMCDLEALLNIWQMSACLVRSFCFCRKWNAKYVAVLLYVLNNMTGFWQTSEV